MKYLKFFISVLILLGVIFIGRGLLTPSIGYECEIVVDKAVKEAWEVMQDESKIKDWLQDITDIKHVSGEMVQKVQLQSILLWKVVKNQKFWKP